MTSMAYAKENGSLQKMVDWNYEKDSMAEADERYASDFGCLISVVYICSSDKKRVGISKVCLPDCLW